MNEIEKLKAEARAVIAACKGGDVARLAAGVRVPHGAVAISFALRHHVRRGTGHRKEKQMNNNWNPDQGFPTPEQVKRMVAAEVKRIAEAEYERERGAEEKRESRRDRLRAAYRIQHKPVGRKVNREAIFFLVGNVASVTFAAWRGLFALDMVALAEAGTREDFDDLEFMVTRALGELNGIKNLLALARRIA